MMRIDPVVILVAFDLLDLDGKDLRREPLRGAQGQAGPPRGLHFNEHIAGPGEIVFRHACKLGLEGNVS